jgi:hypothetical protein
VRLSPLGTAATTGLLYQPQMIHDGGCGAIGWNEDWQGKPKYSEKTCPSATLSTTNPTWPDPRLEPGPATNRLSYGSADLPLIPRGPYRKLLVQLFSLPSAPKLYKQDTFRFSGNRAESQWSCQQSHSPVGRGVACSSQTLLSSKRRPHLKTRRSLEWTKIWSRVPTGPGTKIYCAGEGQP